VTDAVIIPDDSNMIMLPIYASGKRKIDPRMLSQMDFGQKTQIINGINKGLDVSIYANPEFDANQMEVIKEGLQDGLDVSYYADPRFDTEQMDVIRTGLANEFDVSLYANPELDDTKMFSILEGLNSGHDVSSYAKPEFSADQIDVLNRIQSQNASMIQMGGEWAEKTVDIDQLANPNNSPHMLETIATGFGSSTITDTDFIMKRWNNDPYLNDELMSKMDATQKEYIYKGVRSGLDVSIYAKPEFTGPQMIRIYGGLRDGVDVSWYAHPDFSEKQMNVIREGLTAGIDVSSYADSTISAMHMLLAKNQLVKEKRERERGR
jgi:hypothetical protein